MIPVIAGAALIGMVLIGLARQRRFARLRNLSTGLLISYITIVLLFGIGEAYFRFVYADSEGRLASENWMRRYWRDNSLGYRDRDWQERDWAGKTTVALVGDSFTAGWGIEDPTLRFGDVLADRLGDSYAVFNLGEPGSSTPQQLENLQDYPASPVDVVILQYFLNDIDYTVLSLGLQIPPLEIPSIARESHLANFLYSRLTAGFGEDYWARQYAAYDNFAIWSAHREEIDTFIDYVEEIGAQLIVVIFPNMQDPVGSIPYVDRVAQVFEGRGYGEQVIKLFDAAAAWTPPGGAIVSARDAHPSAAFHRYVGELIAARFFTS